MLEEELKVRRGEVSSGTDEMQKLNKSIEFYVKEIAKGKEERKALEVKVKDVERESYKLKRQVQGEK